MSTANWLALLVAIFIIKHVLADFALQTPWMFERKEAAAGWLPPLAAHCAWHGAMTATIALAVAPRLWWLAIVDVLLHAVIDRGKGSVVAHWQLEPLRNKAWWNVFAADQALHQLTHLCFAYVLSLATTS